jgi:hypothetical protein
MKTRKLSFIIAACMLFNNLAFAGSIEAPEEVSSPVIETAVFQLASLVRLPFTITSALIQQESPLAPAFNKAVKGTDNGGANGRKEDNAKKECGFFSNTFNELRLTLRADAPGGTSLSLAAGMQDSPGTRRLSMLFLWLGFKFIFLLACLRSVSKSSLPWEIRESCA